MRVAELKALAREHGLRGYSRLRKAELIALLQNNLSPPQAQAQSVKPTPYGPASGGSLVRKKWIYLNDKRCVKIDRS